MRRQGASGALAAARAVARSITCDPVGATAAFTRTAAVRSVGGSDAQSSSQSATTRFVRQSPAVCGAGAASVRGIQMPGGLGLGFGATHCRAGSTGSPLGLGDYARGARGFRATAPSRKEKDLYKLLNVPKDASASDIKKAYFKLAKKYHPDVNKEAGAKEKFAEINKAYEILSDDSKRQAYDMGGMDADGNQQGFGGFGGFGGAQGFHGNPEDIFKGFEEMFGGQDIFGGGRRGNSKRQGADVGVNLNISFMEAAKGCTKTVEVQMNLACDKCSGSGCSPGTSSKTCSYCQGRGETLTSQMGGMFQVRSTCGPCKGKGKIIEKPCTKCRGAGKSLGRRSVTIDVPAGMDEGVRLRIQGEGEPGSPGMPPGNVLVQCSITPHPFFSRDGNTLYVTMPIGISKAILGGDVQVPTVDGQVTVTLQPGTQPNSQRVMRAKGLPSLQDGSYGDLVITFKVVVPKTISSKQREVLEQFKAEEVEPSGAEPNGRGNRQRH